MIRKYDDNTQLTAHFNAHEFKCKCGQPHDYELSDKLVSMLEQLYEKLNCSKIIVTSGYRCTKHDKTVGGSGTGQHTRGTAADICCYGQDGKPISSKVVCCTAQDLGFGGIANITSEYIYTHVDVRTGYRWLGDETVNNNTVTDDFYKYFGISKTDKPLSNGIDLSCHNGSIDWTKVKADFVILRAGYGKESSQKDNRFEEYYAGAKAHGIPVGAYWYSYAMRIEEAIQEAEVFISTIKGKQFEYPLFYDVEESKQFALGKEKLSAIIRAFLERVEAAGYFVGLYGSASSLTTHTADDIKRKYAIWLAHWCDSTNYSDAYGIWQHSCKGKVDGISGDVDLDKCYVDYPERIKTKGLNGYGVSPSPAPVPDDSVYATVTVDGKKYSGKLNRA
ncbi:MAG: GH25 family lysozyme [Ruminococcus sp.]